MGYRPETNSELEYLRLANVVMPSRPAKEDEAPLVYVVRSCEAKLVSHKVLCIDQASLKKNR